MGPERGRQLLTGRSAEEIAKLLQEIPSDDAAALIDYLPEELSTEVLELMRRRESGQVESLLEYGEQTAGRIMNPQRLRAQRRPDGRRGDHGAAELARRRDGVLPLRRRCAAPPRRRDLAAAPAAGLARDAAQADHDARGHQRPRRHRPGRSGAAGRVVQPARRAGRRRREQARRRHHGGRRHRRHQGRSDRRPASASPACPATSASRRRRSRRFASACRGSASIWSRRSSPPRWSRCSRARFSRSRRWRCSCRSSPAWAATPPRRR